MWGEIITAFYWTFKHTREKEKKCYFSHVNTHNLSSDSECKLNAKCKNKNTFCTESERLQLVSSHSIDDDANKRLQINTIWSVLNLTNCVNIVGNAEEIFKTMTTIVNSVELLWRKKSHVSSLIR